MLIYSKCFLTKSENNVINRSDTGGIFLCQRLNRKSIRITKSYEYMFGFENEKKKAGYMCDKITEKYLPVNSHEPVLCGVSLFQMCELNVFITDFSITCTIITRGCSEIKLKEKDRSINNQCNRLGYYNISDPLLIKTKQYVSRNSSNKAK